MYVVGVSASEFAAEASVHTRWRSVVVVVVVVRCWEGGLKAEASSQQW